MSEALRAARARPAALDGKHEAAPRESKWDVEAQALLSPARVRVPPETVELPSARVRASGPPCAARTQRGITPHARGAYFAWTPELAQRAQRHGGSQDTARRGSMREDKKAPAGPRSQPVSEFDDEGRKLAGEVFEEAHLREAARRRLEFLRVIRDDAHGSGETAHDMAPSAERDLAGDARFQARIALANAIRLLGFQWGERRQPVLALARAELHAPARQAACLDTLLRAGPSLVKGWWPDPRLGMHDGPFAHALLLRAVLLRHFEYPGELGLHVVHQIACRLEARGVRTVTALRRELATGRSGVFVADPGDIYAQLRADGRPVRQLCDAALRASATGAERDVLRSCAWFQGLTLRAVVEEAVAARRRASGDEDFGDDVEEVERLACKCERTPAQHGLGLMTGEALEAAMRRAAQGAMLEEGVNNLAHHVLDRLCVILALYGTEKWAADSALAASLDSACIASARAILTPRSLDLKGPGDPPAAGLHKARMTLLVVEDVLQSGLQASVEVAAGSAERRALLRVALLLTSLVTGAMRRAIENRWTTGRVIGVPSWLNDDPQASPQDIAAVERTRAGIRGWLRWRVTAGVHTAGDALFLGFKGIGPGLVGLGRSLGDLAFLAGGYGVDLVWSATRRVARDVDHQAL